MSNMSTSCKLSFEFNSTSRAIAIAIKSLPQLVQLDIGEGGDAR